MSSDWSVFWQEEQFHNPPVLRRYNVLLYLYSTSNGRKGNPRRRAVVPWPDLNPDTDAVVAGSEADSESGQTIARNSDKTVQTETRHPDPLSEVLSTIHILFYMFNLVYESVVYW